MHSHLKTSGWFAKHNRSYLLTVENMRFALAATFLAQAFPNLAIEGHRINSSQATHHQNYKNTLTSGVKTKSKNNHDIFAVKGELKNEPIHVYENPTAEAKEVDIGVLGYGYKEYSMDDLSLAINKAKQRNQYEENMFLPPAVCDSNSEQYNHYGCDCTGFSVEENRGSFACISAEDYCTEEGLCGPEIISNTIYDDGSVRSDHCYNFDNPFGNNVCYTRHHSMSNGNESDTCSIYVDDVQCNKCRINEDDCYEFDCTNTVARIQGINCEGGDYVLSMLSHQHAFPPELDPSRIFPPATVCDKRHADYQLYDCDCSDFDVQRMRGSFSCTTKNEFCLTDGFCGYNEITNTITNDGQILTHYCYYLNEEHPMSVCYSSYGDDCAADSCAIHVDGVQCNSCLVVDGVVNKDGKVEDGCTQFDCTNTLVGNEGIDCLGDHIFDAFMKTILSEESQPSASKSSMLPPQAMLLKSRVLASGFTFKSPTNSTISRKVTAVS
jgi:hypothetical protein